MTLIPKVPFGGEQEWVLVNTIAGSPRAEMASTHQLETDVKIVGQQEVATEAIHDNPSEAQGQPLLNIDPMNGDQGLQHYNFGSAAQEFGGIGMLSPQECMKMEMNQAYAQMSLATEIRKRISAVEANAARQTRKTRTRVANGTSKASRKRSVQTYKQLAPAADHRDPHYIGLEANPSAHIQHAMRIEPAINPNVSPIHRLELAVRPYGDQMQQGMDNLSLGPENGGAASTQPAGPRKRKARELYVEILPTMTEEQKLDATKHNEMVAEWDKREKRLRNNAAANRSRQRRLKKIDDQAAEIENLTAQIKVMENEIAQMRQQIAAMQV